MLKGSLNRTVDGYNEYLGTEIQPHMDSHFPPTILGENILTTSSDQDKWLFLCQVLPDTLQLCTGQSNSPEPSLCVNRLPWNPVKTVQPVTAISPRSCLLWPSPCNWKSVRSRTFVTKLIKSSPSPRSPCRYAIPIPKQQEKNYLKTMHAPSFLTSIVICNLVKYQRHFFLCKKKESLTCSQTSTKFLNTHTGQCYRSGYCASRTTNCFSLSVFKWHMKTFRYSVKNRRAKNFWDLSFVPGKEDGTFRLTLALS